MLSTEWQPPEREKIFANHLSNKSLVSKIQRELKFNNKNPIQCLIKYLTNICPKIYKQPVSTWKDLQHYQSLRKYKSKLRRDATSYPGGWLSKSKQKLENNNGRQGCEKKKRKLYTTGGRQYSCRGNGTAVPQKIKNRTTKRPSNSTSAIDPNELKAGLQEVSVHPCT